MSGNYTQTVKEKKCKGCREIFGAKKKAGQYGGFQSYCPRCVKHKVYFGYKISDEGVVYENA